MGWRMQVGCFALYAIGACYLVQYVIDMHAESKFIVHGLKKVE